MPRTRSRKAVTRRGSNGCLSSEHTFLRQHCSNEVTIFFFFWLCHTEVNVSFFRVDGVLKHMTESRDFEHRLRALENEVK